MQKLDTENLTVTDGIGLNGRRQWRAIFLGGATAGALDLIYVISVFGLLGLPASNIVQTIASGILGKAAFAGGAATVALGVGLHFMMTLIMAGIYYLMAPDTLRRRPFIGGPLYGAAIWLVMNFIVVPLSAAPIGIPPAPIAVADFACHMFLVGLPIAWFSRRRGPPADAAHR